MKTITIIGINYYPEETAIGLYTTQLAEYFQSEDIAVKVITGFPYYPFWKINKEYLFKKKILKENINKIEVFRYKQYVPKNPIFFKRILHLIDFTLGSLINIFKIKKTDIVLCVVPFTSTILLGKILCKLTKAKLWVHVQDFEFDAASEANIVKRKISFFFKFLFWIEKKLLNSANLISTISNSMILKLEKKTSMNIEKVFLPNWVDIDKINPKKAKTHPYLTSKKFKILYSGNIGEKQNWQFFLKFIERLKFDNTIEFIIVGDGSKRKWLEDKLSKIKNVSFYMPVAYDELSDMLCSTDLHILFQKEDVIDTVMPSKILAMMASQKTSLITGNLKSEVATIINKSDGGAYFDSNNIDEIIKFVFQLKRNAFLREKHGKNARNFVSLNFSKDLILKQFKNTFLHLIK